MVFYMGLVGPNLHGAFNENDPTNPAAKTIDLFLMSSSCF